MNIVIKRLLIASSLLALALEMIAPLWAVFVQGIGGGLFTAGASYGAYSIAGGVLIFIISRWEDKVKHQELLIASGYLLTSMGILLLLLISSVWQLYVAQVLLGFGLALFTPAFDGLYSKYLTKGHESQEWGYSESSYMIIAGFAGILGGYLADTYGFVMLLFVALLLSLAGCVVALSLYFIKND